MTEKYQIKMKYLLFGLILTIFYSVVNSTIVPQELPSVLSLVYSNIPQIKKGTDSRIGFGFRLGEHADFQVVFELGPQQETKPLGPQNPDDDSSSDTSKRNINPDDYVKYIKATNGQGTNWLKSWSQEMKKQKKNQNGNSNKKVTVQSGPIMSDTTLKQLQQLYGGKQQNSPGNTNPIKIENQVNTGSNSVSSSSSSSISSNIISNSSPRTSVEQEKITSDLMDVEFD